MKRIILWDKHKTNSLNKKFNFKIPNSKIFFNYKLIKKHIKFFNIMICVAYSFI